MKNIFRPGAIFFSVIVLMYLFRNSAEAQLSSNVLPGVTVDASYPGGNVILDKIDGNTVYVRQDLRDTKGDWFYWNFRVRGAKGRSLNFQFTRGNVIGVRGPAVSLDAGNSWAWLGTNTVRGASFSYVFPAAADDVRFAFAIPYLESNLKEFIKRHESNPALKVEVLCRTARGREVELLRVGNRDKSPKYRVLLTARHHACESVADYSMEGLLDFALGNDEDGKWLRENVEIIAVPFVDKDGVEDGDQGKNRKPHDHGRDYGETTIYSSTRALKERIPEWARGRLDILMDIHCPWIRGDLNETVYFIGGANQANWERNGEFCRILASVCKGPLPYLVQNNLPWGKSWNTTANFQPGQKGIKGWAEELPYVKLVAGMEIPYANASGAEVNPESARALGRDIARAIRKYLE